MFAYHLGGAVIGLGTSEMLWFNTKMSCETQTSRFLLVNGCIPVS